MARPYCVVVALLLLAEVSGFKEGASSPGFVARITRKGLEYGKGGRVSAISLVSTVTHQSGVVTRTRDHRLGFCPCLAQKPWICPPLGCSFLVLSIRGEGRDQTSVFPRGSVDHPGIAGT